MLVEEGEGVLQGRELFMIMPGEGDPARAAEAAKRAAEAAKMAAEDLKMAAAKREAEKREAENRGGVYV